MPQHLKPKKIYSFDEADNRLYDIFRHHGFADFDHDQRHQLVRFYRLLMLNQNEENFTRLIKFRDIAIKHFIDCLMVDRLCQLRFPLLDLGTGPGFPGIPLKILYPAERIVLAEGVRKRVEFLKRVRDELQLQNLDLIGRKIDEDFVLPMQTVITRAVAAVGPTLKAVRGCLQPGGQMVFMKGPNVDPELAKAAREWSGEYELIKDQAYQLPATPHERRLIIFQRRQNPAT